MSDMGDTVDREGTLHLARKARSRLLVHYLAPYAREFTVSKVQYISNASCWNRNCGSLAWKRSAFNEPEKRGVLATVDCEAAQALKSCKVGALAMESDVSMTKLSVGVYNLAPWHKPRRSANPSLARLLLQARTACLKSVARRRLAGPATRPVNTRPQSRERRVE